MNKDQRERAERNRQEALARKWLAPTSERKHARSLEESDEEFISSLETSVTPAAKRSTPSTAESPNHVQPMPLLLPETQISESQEADLDRVEAEAAAQCLSSTTNATAESAVTSPVARRRESSLGYSQEWADEEFQGEALAGLDAAEAGQQHVVAELDAEAAGQQHVVDAGVESEEVPTDVDEPVAASPASASADRVAKCAADAAKADAEGRLGGWPFRLRFALLAAGYRDDLNWSQNDLDTVRAAFESDGLRGATAALQARPNFFLKRKQLGADAAPSDGHVRLFSARVLKSGDVVALSVTAHGRTIAHAVLGEEYLLRVHFEEEDHPTKGAEGKLVRQGFTLAGQHYCFACFKGGKTPTYWFVAVGTRWPTVYAALSRLANFGSCKTIQKYQKRPELLFSQTLDMRQRWATALGLHHFERVADGQVEWREAPPPEGVLRFVEVEDVRGQDEQGADIDSAVMEDGVGLISLDLCVHIPPVQRGRDLGADGDSLRGFGLEGRDLDGAPGPLVSQGRFYYGGSLAKGTLLRCATLPLRTIVLRRSMVKVDGGAECAAKAFWAVEVCQTSELARSSRTTSQLVPLLEAIGKQPAVDRLLQLAEEEMARIVECQRKPSLRTFRELNAKCYQQDERSEDDRFDRGVSIEVRALWANFHDPYISKSVAKQLADKLLRLRKGSFMIPHSYNLMGVADPTGTVPAGKVVVVREGRWVAARAALLYRSPGIHPGDVREAQIAPPSVELKQALEVDGRLGQRDNAVIFSTRGARSMADEMAGGDYDGDIYSVICDSKLVEACRCLPACTQAELDAVVLQQKQQQPGGGPSILGMNERDRDSYHASHVLKGLRAREKRMAVGTAANTWLRSVEIRGHGANHPQMREIACIYMLSLDVGKTGQQVKQPPRIDCPLPLHLKHHKGAQSFDQYLYEGDTALARLWKMEPPTSAARPTEQDYHALIPPDFRPGGPRWEEQLTFHSKWLARLKRYNGEVEEILADKEEGKDASLRRAVAFTNLYAGILCELEGDRSDEELASPSLNSTLNAEVAALYCVSCKEQRKNPGMLAWKVACRYLCLLKLTLKKWEQSRTTGDKGPPMAIDEDVAADMLAQGGRRRAPPMSESQELDVEV